MKSNKLEESLIKNLIESENDNTENDIVWENIEDYTEEEKIKVRNIVSHLNPEVIQKDKSANGYDVAVKDNNSGLVFWVDCYRDEYGEWQGDWNQYIFHTDNEDDRIRQAVQTSYSAKYGDTFGYAEIVDEAINSLDTNE